jgi:hypothetical protein
MKQKSPPSEHFLRRTSASAERNSKPILEILKTILPKNSSVLEIGSGTGQHGVMFAESLTSIKWIPSDYDVSNLNSIKAWNRINVTTSPFPPRLIDATELDWDISLNDNIFAIVAINVIHISSWSVTKGILLGAQRFLPSKGILYFYGPFKQTNIVTAQGNETFDKQLRSQNTAWGLRNLNDIETIAQNHDLKLEQIIQMPANNLSVIFRKN